MLIVSHTRMKVYSRSKSLRKINNNNTNNNNYMVITDKMMLNNRPDMKMVHELERITFLINFAVPLLLFYQISTL